MLAVIVAILIGFGSWQYLNTQKTTVYLYNNDFSQGTRISKEMFASTQLDTSVCNAMAGTGNRYVTADDIMQYIAAGDCLLVDVAKYTVSSANQFVASGGTEIESRLAKNMVSVELPVESVAGFSAGVRIGSRLNVVTGYTVDMTKSADLIFQDLLVVDVVNDSNGVLKSVYVEVEPSESVHLMHSIMFENTAVSIIKPGYYTPINSTQAFYKRNYSSEVMDIYFGGTQSEPAGSHGQQSNNGVTLGQGQGVQY